MEKDIIFLRKENSIRMYSGAVNNFGMKIMMYLGRIYYNERLSKYTYSPRLFMRIGKEGLQQITKKLEELDKTLE